MKHLEQGIAFPEGEQTAVIDKVMTRLLMVDLYPAQLGTMNRGDAGFPYGWWGPKIKGLVAAWHYNQALVEQRIEEHEKAEQEELKREQEAAAKKLKDEQRGTLLDNEASSGEEFCGSVQSNFGVIGP